VPSGDPLIDHLSGRKLAALISLYRYPLWTDDMRTLFHQWLFNSPTGGMSGGCDRRRSPRARDDGQGIRRERDPAGRLGQARCLEAHNSTLLDTSATMNVWRSVPRCWRFFRRSKRLGSSILLTFVRAQSGTRKKRRG